MAKAPNFKKFRKIVGNDIDALRTEMLAMRTELENAQQQIREVSLTQNAAAIKNIQGVFTDVGWKFKNAFPACG